MGKKLFTFIVLIGISCAAAAQTVRVAVADFEVTSDDPSLRYVGKGLAEMVSGELGQLKGVTVIDREKRAQALEELEFALSEAPDGNGPRTGKILAADYILYGSLIDMGGSILLSAKLTSVETGEICWSAEKLGELSGYGELSADIAREIAVSRGLDGSVKAAALPSRESKGSKDTILAYSAALDALDRGDQEEARRQIQKAAAADSENPSVRDLFDRLVAPGPRYRAEVEFYAPLESPADAALQDSGALGLWFAMDLAGIQSQYGQYANMDFSVSGRAEFSIPLGERFSLRIEGLSGTRASNVSTMDESPVIAGSSWEIYLGQAMNGGGAGFGIRLAQGLAIGFSGLIYKSDSIDSINADGQKLISEYARLGAVGTEYGASASLSYKNPASTLFAGFQASWTSLPCLYFSVPAPDGGGSVEEGTMPLVFEANVIGRIPGKRLFGSLRGVVEQDLDARGGTFIRLLPGAEYWFDDYLSARASAEINAYRGLSPLAIGLGGFVGVSLSFGGYELSANLLVSSRHSRVIPQVDEANQPMATLLVGMTWKGFAKRKAAR
jgi:TolB-like protein